MITLLCYLVLAVDRPGKPLPDNLNGVDAGWYIGAWAVNEPSHRSETCASMFFADLYDENDYRLADMDCYFPQGFLCLNKSGM